MEVDSARNRPGSVLRPGVSVPTPPHRARFSRRLPGARLPRIREPGPRGVVRWRHRYGPGIRTGVVQGLRGPASAGTREHRARAVGSRRRSRRDDRTARSGRVGAATAAWRTRIAGSFRRFLRPFGRSRPVSASALRISARITPARRPGFRNPRRGLRAAPLRMSQAKKASARSVGAHATHDDPARAGKNAGILLGALLVVLLVLISGFLWIVMGGSF